MDVDSPQLQPQNFDISESKKRTIKSFLTILIVFIALFLLGISFYLTKNKATSKSEMTIKSTPKQDTPKEILNWLNTQKDERGFYNHAVNCDTKSCQNIEKAGGSGHDGIAVIWARYKYYQKYHDANDLALVNEDINNYEKQLDKMEIQNDFWNCNLMYELWKSSDFNEDQKKKIERICWTGTYLTIPETESFSLRRSDDNFLFRSETNLLKDVKKTDLLNPETTGKISDSKIVGRVREISSYPSDFVSRYYWKNNKKDLDIAEAYFNKITDVYFKKPEIFTNNDVCTLGISSFDLYKATLGQDYLNFSKNIAENKTNLGSPICGILADKLFNETNDNKYKTSRNETTALILKSFYDSKGVENKLVGAGGFFKINSENKFIFRKEIRENALMVSLLLDEK